MSSKKRKVGEIEGAMSTPAPVIFEDDFDGELSPRMNAFCREYIVDNIGTQAALRAGYGEAGAGVQAHLLLKNPKIQENIRRRRAAAADAAQVSAELVLSELFLTATADPRELVTVTQESCRFCYGIEGRRQWTRGEYEQASSEATRDGKPSPDFAGGFGFDPRRPPLESCGECFGEGETRVKITPSAKLSRAATRLLNSVNQKKDGSIEVKLNDRMAATLALAKITGLLKDRTELSGPGGGPIALTAVRDLQTMTNEELKAYLLTHGHPVLDQQLTLTEGDEQP